MIYRKFNPCDKLHSFIECYYLWEIDLPKGESMVIESPPNGFCSVVFNLGDCYSIENKKYDRLKVPQQFIAGQSIYSYKLHISGHLNVAGIVFKPAALASLYHLPIYEYTEERMPLSNVFEEAFLKNYVDGLQQAETAVQKVELLEKFVLAEINLKDIKPDIIDAAANKIVEANGIIQINDLMKTVCMSKRSFERNFFKKVGLSPKYFARIRRLSFLANLVAGKKKVDWQQVLTECDYYDQSHFIKDFIEFTGRSPEKYLQDNVELANFISKPKPENLT
ncbi:MAG: helix-turn-helix domain-containing protein [Pedobacter sp.]|uniref:helix-turn-helix domain-containing protein n=1 Tax=Pedobacter sp. TaxID=1411316 RepID=UPI002807E995|nr:helix-turn-helix domain-containing protein [Pedobacter sp.]MDQ8005917.1 helix-turn-helix domain-containing protein [Pedobacter sp.]